MDENRVSVVLVWTSAVEVVLHENLGCSIVVEWICDSKVFGTSASVNEVVPDLIDVNNFDGIEPFFNFLLEMIACARPFIKKLPEE